MGTISLCLVNFTFTLPAMNEEKYSNKSTISTLQLMCAMHTVHARQV